jgi:hypothetical protein
MTLVTSVCHFTRHGVFQEHNPMANKALMCIQVTKAQCLLWLSDYEGNHNPRFGGSNLSVAHRWSNEFASKHKLNADITRKTCYFTFYIQII